jgi:ATP-dependent helicase HepA
VQDFISGQRWISDTELPLGLGTVLESDQRTVTILFMATGDTRIYAKQTAPLTRVVFAPGDSVRDHKNRTLKISSVTEQDGLLCYFGTRENGTPGELEEGLLDHFIQLNRPIERLFSAQIDHPKWFELRYQTRCHANRIVHSDLYGLTGSRTRLIPHQLYIAHEVANRYAPRVLLADEVGLGKTIEAGLILHHQLLTGRAQRVLIVVPETLVHQWLVEMLRRFNRHFSIFDEERCRALETDNDAENPFATEQLILCSQAFLTANPEHAALAADGEWDLLVVDEAHHLQWAPTSASSEYQIIAQLAASTRGVLLLTATPEQLGKASHFARLRLLDPNRFPNYEAFLQEEQAYAPIAEVMHELLDDRPLNRRSHGLLLDTLGVGREADNQRLLDILHNPESNADEQDHARQQLISNLIDRHGTGRVLFRNTRAAIKGFPQRELHASSLPLPAVYAACLSPDIPVEQRLCPEKIYSKLDDSSRQHWTRFDPRIPWLADTLQTLCPGKVLIITAHAGTTLDIARALKDRYGMHAAVFHEGLSIVERDRAAAYFADRENGSQMLVCSEIGSEGRNFQFAHHLILFDLPLNPDLLEQRIGRLDRIGQTETIHIHVPYFQNSAQEILYRWYHEALSAFEHTCPTGHSIFSEMNDTLLEALRETSGDSVRIAHLIKAGRQRHQALNEALHRGRDRLLEYNSCRPEIANDLRDRALVDDEEIALQAYLEAAFDCFGVDTEVHSHHIWIIHPGPHMQTHLPGLPDTGMTITYNRDTALANEDIQFLSWEHPLLNGVMDLVLSSEMGNTAVSAAQLSGIKPGTLLLECLYILESAAGTVQADRYQPPTTIRIFVDQDETDHHSRLDHALINRARQTLDAETAGNVVCARTPELRAMADCAERLAQAQATDLLNAARARGERTLCGEIERLKALREINPNVREMEIDYFEAQWALLRERLQSTTPRLDALRVIVAI